jgi:hypothetical protein
MAVLTWDPIGSRTYETGVDQGVLYIPDGAGAYSTGVAWNGLTAVTEQPSGAEANAQYADNIKYLNLYSLEQFAATVEAFTYPDEWNQFDGLVVQNAGVQIGQQPRKLFGLCYRTKLGNDLNDDAGFKYHLMYGCKASPSEKAYSTVNDTPAPINFSWSVNTTPVAVTGQKPTSLVVVDSTKVSAGGLTALTQAIYGTAGTAPRLPLPDEVITMMAGSNTPVTAAALQTGAPTFNATSGVVTITAVTGITWLLTNAAVTNAVVTAGATTGANIPASGGNAVVIRAVPSSGAFTIASFAQTSWTFIRT